MKRLSRDFRLIFFASGALFAVLKSNIGIRFFSYPGKSYCAFLPENSLSIPPQALGSGLSELDYLTSISKIQQSYGPVFKLTGHPLTVQSDWDDDRVNSYATRDDNENPVLIASGGMARHPLMTNDGMLAILCHEVGHFLGGAPKIHRGNTDLLSWSSAEGEADYFAASKCLKNLFSDERENERIVRALPLERQSQLNKKCDSYRCMRILEAGRAVTEVFAAVTPFAVPPSLDALDTTPAQALVYIHPSPQCRLDTFVHGALCSISPSSPIDDLDPNRGACVDPAGGRPNCWFVAY